MAKRPIAITLIIVGTALFIGVGLFAMDKATSAEPDGLGTWIFTVLGLLLGASTGIKGWLDWNKKETPSQATNITARENGQVATGSQGRNIQAKEYTEQNIEHYHEASKTDRLISPLHQLPPAPADFTGRETIIAELLNDFNAHKGATISGLTGMGGIGKTALGLVIANQIKDKYPDSQIFLDLKGTTTPLSATDLLRYVILSFEPTADLRALDEANMSAAYQSVLHGKKVLLFLDNARSAEQIALLRPPEACAMLVTSRWTFTVPGLGSRRVDVMSADDAQKFLLDLCPRIKDHAAELARACAYLPLALRIAGSFLQVNANWNVDKYLVELKSAKGRFETFAKSRAGADLTTEPDVLATFELSYNQLKVEEQKNWRALGVFPAPFDGTAATAVWAMEENDADNLLAIFMRYSLIDYNETASRYELHDLLAEYAQSLMESREEQEARIAHSVHYSNLLFNINQLFLKGGANILNALKLYDSEWIHIETGQRYSVVYLDADRKSAEACNDYAWQGSINELRLKPRDRIRWLESGLKAFKALENKESEGAHLGNLGIAYKNLGDARKAIEFHEQTLLIHREIGDRLGEGTSLGNLGNAYLDLGDARKAIEFHEQTLLIHREIGDRRGEGNDLFNMGLSLHKLEEKEKAIDLVKQALKIYQAIESPTAERARNRLKEWGALE